ncbi:flagellar hook-basal body complex protein [Amphritea sp. HPY]|uniref:flagellar hook-basal body complex protein n=1 Tax=Amphritea sp. HPY TaxID=3421652 RepID=UPI003D7C6145
MAGFNTAITGLKAATTDLDVTGNNIANASTVGFKASRTEFGDIYTSAVVGAGSSNTPGSGVTVTDIAQDFSAGTVESTNNNLDLAINGGGYFELADEQGGKTYTRAGAFELDKDGFIVNKTGQFLQGFPVENGVELPLGNLAVTEKESPPQATYEMSLELNIDDRKDASQLLSNYNKDVPASYTYSTTMERVDSLGDSSVIKYNFVEQRPVKEVHTYDFVDGGSGDLSISGFSLNTADFTGPGGTLDATVLGNLQAADPRIFDVVLNQPSAGEIQVIFNSESTQYGNLVTTDVAGGVALTNESITEIAAGEQHIFNFTGGPNYGAGDVIELSVAGVNISIDGGVGGVTAEDIVNEINAQRSAITDSNSNIDTLVYDSANNSLVISYRADAGDIASDSLDMQILSGPVDPFGGAVPSAAAIAPDTEVNGDDSYEGTYRLYAYLLNAGASGEDQTLTIGKAPDPGELGSLPEKGPVLINFNQSSGILSEINGVAVTSNLSVPGLTVQGFSDNDPILANGTDSQDVITLDLSNTSQFASDSIVKNSSQNGYAKGDLIGVSFGIDGEMVASFSNGQNQTLGVVAIATFENQAGLQPVGDTQWAASLSSGSAITNPPGTGLNGTLKSGSLEQSNVDLSEQLVKLIEAQRNFQANSKTLETLNTVTQAILQI